MVRVWNEQDLPAVMGLWLDTNIKAHHFIPEEYWTSNYAAVKDLLPQAELYVHEDDASRQVDGFIGLTGDYIAGIFVAEAVQSKGIGKQLLDCAKKIRSTMSLSVYQKNTRAVLFYQREQFVIQSESIDSSTNEKEFTMVWSK